MADLVSYGNAHRDIEQALIALKKGTQLLKYGLMIRSLGSRLGSVMHWNDLLVAIDFGLGSSIESGLANGLGMKSLFKGLYILRSGWWGTVKLQLWQRFEDESSLIWISSSGERSLKLASVSRIIPGQRTAVFQRYLRPEKDYLSFSLIYNSGKRSLDLICKDKVETEVWIAGLKALVPSGQGGRSKIDGRSDGGVYFEHNRDLTSKSPSDSPASATQNISSPDVSVSSNTNSSPKSCQPHNSVHSERSHVALDQANMQVKGSGSDTFRVSVSSAPSTSSHGSAPDDCDALGDVYIWGEVLCDNLVKIGADKKFHTCAVTMAGELYTWGDGTHNAGILGHGTDLSHWIPKRISGPLEGLQIAMVTCGPWHTALVTSTGQLFTFGDGTFGVLGHGDRESVSYPREVDSLSGLRTIAVACGVWHTAAIVEVIVTQSSASVSSGKLFTWGDGDKSRLGHGDKEPRLEPTCVPALIDYNFHKIACGHSLTVGLTTSGHVFAMGSTVYGQLGNPQSDGKLPCLVEDKLIGESVQEIACGAYHVAVLTSRNEVYTWGKGANGRLGHGDIEDRKTPTLVEALKDRHVKFIACGSNYTSAICLHRWVSGAEQSQCSACRQPFGFTRKRHNCYNCGLVHCHSCSSRKSLRAALAPNPSKPYRVCDSCYAKLSKVAEVATINKKNVIPRLSGENKDRIDKAEIRLSKSGMPSNVDLIKQLDNKAAKQGKKADNLSLGRPSQAPSLLQLKDVVMSTALDLCRTVPKPVVTPSGVNSRPVSPFSRKPSPPRSATPIPTTAGLSFSKSSDSLKKTNELLNQEVHKLRMQIESLQRHCEVQELELQKSVKKAQEAIALAAEESAKSKAAKDAIKSLMAQLKDMAARLPPEVDDGDSTRAFHIRKSLEPNGIHYPDSNGVCYSDSIDDLHLAASTGIDHPATTKGMKSPGSKSPRHDHPDGRLPNGNGVVILSDAPDGTESGPIQDGDSMRSRNSAFVGSANQVEAEWIEQYEPGVYITLVALRDGTRDLKRVRFSCTMLGPGPDMDLPCESGAEQLVHGSSRRRFGEHQAETWWSENREKVYDRYNVRGLDKASVSGQTARRSEGGGVSPSSQL
ncbi:hypothetical protein RHSIM_Rhsim06G0090700 [Rhododendron simsii]|uniref:Uncharacterized protein n=1 Tax=Rhododendron simsii TaxID=118357 RepID=A0A834GVU2_RHOSS|nr:hypothetical protein RHSIM_Rhsim06G0090700 [Rhododendron simsii]